MSADAGCVFIAPWASPSNEGSFVQRRYDGPNDIKQFLAELDYHDGVTWFDGKIMFMDKVQTGTSE